MVRSTILGTVSAIVCIGLSTTCLAQQTTAEKMHMQCLMMTDLDQRIDACTAAINTSGLSENLLGDAYAIRGIMHFRRGDFAESRADIKSALAADPSGYLSESAEILENIDRILETIDRIEKSVSELSPKQALDACTHWRDPTRRLDACDQFVKSVDTAPDQQPMALMLRGSVKVMLGHFDDGMADIESAIRLEPGNSTLKERKADALWRIGRYDEAMELMDQLVAAGSDPNQWVNEYMVFAYLKGQLEKAAKIAESSQDALPNSSLPAFLAALIRAEGAPQNSKAFDSVRAFPSDGPFAATVLAYRQGHATEQQVLDSANALPVSSRRNAMCQAHFNIAHRSALAGERAKAGNEFRQSVVDCGRGSFEYVISNVWLNRLGQTQ